MNTIHGIGRVVVRIVIGLMGLALLQVGGLIWFLAVTQTQQHDLQQIALDHEQRLRTAETTLHFTSSSKTP